MTPEYLFIRILIFVRNFLIFTCTACAYEIARYELRTQAA